MVNRLLKFFQEETGPAPQKKKKGYKPKRSGKDRFLLCRFHCYSRGSDKPNGSPLSLTTDGQGHYRVHGKDCGPAEAVRAFFVWSLSEDLKLDYADRFWLKEIANEFLMPLEEKWEQSAGEQSASE